MRLFYLLALAGMAFGQQGFEFTEVTPESLLLKENGKPVYQYNHGVMLKEGAPANRARCCYVHPVYSPDGVVVTDDFPEDHYHHRGVFWVWPIVEIDGKRHDLWLIEGVRKKFVKWHGREAGEGGATLKVENGWYASDERVVRELVEIVARPERNGKRRLEFTLTFEALEKPVGLQGDPTDQKGYGGFSVRFAPREKTRIVTDSGVEKGDSNMVPHAWAEESGEFAEGRASLRIDIDPSNPGAPNGWCLRHYGFLGVNYPGNEKLVLKPGAPLTLRYGVEVE